jgi:iron-sulfur cluster assembly accessory protein
MWRYAVRNTRVEWGMARGSGYVVQEGNANSDGRHGTAEPTGSQHMTVSADTSSADTSTKGVILTDVAAEKAKSLLEQQGEEGLALRVQVQPGGCSGLIYQLYFDDREVDGDAVQDFNGLSVRVDRMSVPYLSGATIDFVDTIEKQGFTIDNPNAGGSCACGDSFH